MKPLLVEEIDKDDVFDGCYRIAFDEFINSIDFEPIFFYGKLVDDSYLQDAGIDERKTYCRCPICGELFTITPTQRRQPDISCPHCHADGKLFNYRDEKQPLSDTHPQYIAYIQTYEDGYCLRLFEAFADYSERDYDDYTTLSYEPALRFFEYGREYYHDGCLKYYLNQLEDECDGENVWVEVGNIDDGHFWLANSDDDIIEELTSSPYLGDLKEYDENEPIMYYLTKELSYNAFRSLQKYGFTNLFYGLIYAPREFPDSSKISEVLGVDYNQIIANVGEDITVTQLRAARKLCELNLCPTIQNIGLILQMDKIGDIDSFKLTSDNAHKIFKYLRNQQNKHKNENIGRDYVDYLIECGKLDFDMGDNRVLFPTDLEKAHTHTTSLLKIKKDEAIENGVKKAYKKYYKLCTYDNGELCVIMPKNCDEIILEGKRQSHCVGNYVERVAKGEDLILFVRHSAEKDTPFYTMEIRPIMRKLDIVQCRGYHNEDKSSEIRAQVDKFLAEYENWFNHRKLTVTDNTTRMFYKAVKKIDGKYISAWDNKTEYIIGQVLETVTDKNPDKVATKGIHVASLEFAQQYGDKWDNVAILELEVDIQDLVVPDAKDQVRASRVKVLREVPFEEMGDWGAKRIKKPITEAA